MIKKELFEGPVGDYCIARNTIKCLFILEATIKMVVQSNKRKMQQHQIIVF